MLLPEIIVDFADLLLGDLRLDSIWDVTKVEAVGEEGLTLFLIIDGSLLEMIDDPFKVIN